jgi:hypothetical protein
MWRVLCALALIASPTAASAKSSSVEDVVPYLQCQDGWYGTGVAVRGDMILTASHVAANAPCYANGILTRVAYNDPKIDFAILEPVVLRRLVWGRGITCSIAWNARYRTVGYGHQMFRSLNHRSVAYYSNPKYPQWDMTGALVGNVMVIPGMSGGPTVERRTGKIAAINVAADSNPKSHYSFVRWLAQTPLCDPSSRWYIA